MTLYEQALAIQRRISDLEGEAETLRSMANLEAEQKRPERASELYRQAIAISQKLKDAYGEASAIEGMASLESEQGHSEKARELYKRAIQLFQKVGNAGAELDAFLSLAELDVEHGNDEGYQEALERALKRPEAAGPTRTRARILRVLADLDAREGNFEQTTSRLTEAKAIYARLKKPERVKRLSKTLLFIPVLKKIHEARKAFPALLASGFVYVIEVNPTGQAAKLGVKPGDILLDYAGTRLDSVATLTRLTSASAPSSRVTMNALRGANKLRFDAKGGLLGILHGFGKPLKPRAATAADRKAPGGSGDGP
jgi:tetratricopeptide (TPR) repeat protein